MTILKLGNGLRKLRAVRLAGGKWGVVFSAPDGHGETGDGWPQNKIYFPADDDVILEISNLESGGKLQAVLNQAMAGAWQLANARPDVK